MLDKIVASSVEMETKIDMGKAQFFFLTGAVDKAEEEYKKILNSALNTHGENHEDVFSCFEKLALIAKKRGNYEDAIRCYRRAINIANNIEGHTNATSCLGFHSFEKISCRAFSSSHFFF